MRGEAPRAAGPNEGRHERDHAPGAQVLLQGQTPGAATRVGVQGVGAYVAEHADDDGNQHHALRFGEERERVEEQGRKRRVGERRLNHAVIVQGRGVQVLGEPLVIENGHGAQAVNGEIHAAGGVAQDSEQEIGAHRQER